MYRRKNKKWIFLIAPLAIAAFAAFIWIVMLLWNGVLAAAIGVKVITYWQAAGIFLLCKILFGFNGGWRGRRSGRRWNMMQEKFASMSPEEKEQFKAEWKEKCNRWRGRTDVPQPAGE